MKPRISATVGLLLLATCSGDFGDQSSSSPESTAKALGTVPASEVAVWQKVSSSNLPDGRYLQAVAFDESRRMVVMFGGITYTRSAFTTSLSCASPTGNRVALASNSGRMLLCAGARCWTRTKAMPVLRGSACSNWRNASNPPADAPMPTTGNGAWADGLGLD